MLSSPRDKTEDADCRDVWNLGTSKEYCKKQYSAVEVNAQHFLLGCQSLLKSQGKWSIWDEIADEKKGNIYSLWWELSPNLVEVIERGEKEILKFDVLEKENCWVLMRRNVWLGQRVVAIKRLLGKTGFKNPPWSKSWTQLQNTDKMNKWTKWTKT